MTSPLSLFFSLAGFLGCNIGEVERRKRKEDSADKKKWKERSLIHRKSRLPPPPPPPFPIGAKGTIIGGVNPGLEGRQGREDKTSFFWQFLLLLLLSSKIERKY